MNKFLSAYNIKMNEKTLKFSNNKINKKKFYKSKQAIDLDSVTTDRIVVSDKFRHSEVLKVEIVKVISIILVIKKMKLLDRYVLYYLK